MPNWILQLVISYVLTQLGKLGTSVNWTQIAADAVAEILALIDKYVPAFLQQFINPGIQALVNAAVEALSLALTDSADLALVIGDLQAKDWKKALADIEALLAKVIHPSQPPLLDAVKQLQLAA